jgi:gluconolactonase
VADTGKMFDKDANQRIRCYQVTDNTVEQGVDFYKVSSGCADGFRLDEDGNIWTSAADGVHCISPEGVFLGKILIPETVSNICFGGRAKHQLFITATTSLYCITLNRSGILRP